VGIYPVQGKDKRNRTGRLLTCFLLFFTFLSFIYEAQAQSKKYKNNGFVEIYLNNLQKAENNYVKLDHVI
jgi:hypothetical protein